WSTFLRSYRLFLSILIPYTTLFRSFTDSEWDRFFTECIANTNEGIVEKTRKIQNDHIQILKREDGTTKNIYLLDKKNIHNNRLRSEEHTSELQSRENLVCRLLLDKK